MSGVHPQSSRDAQLPYISSEEIIIRRVPAVPPDMVKDRPGIGLTATSFALRPPPGKPEERPSWSRKSITSPTDLLRLVEQRGRDITGWHVCEVAVSIVRELGLDVHPDPTEDDKGHCVIVPTSRQRFTDTIWSKLARQARVVYTHPAQWRE